MLAQDWRELETLSERMTEIRERYSAARRCNNVGLLHTLANQMEAVSRQREHLIRQISRELGSFAA